MSISLAHFPFVFPIPPVPSTGPHNLCGSLGFHGAECEPSHNILRLPFLLKSEAPCVLLNYGAMSSVSLGCTLGCVTPKLLSPVPLPFLLLLQVHNSIISLVSSLLEAPAMDNSFNCSRYMSTSYFTHQSK